jgi:RNA polymerase sigma-70 factor (ECF subfamily)
MEADSSLLAAARKMDGDALIGIFDLYAPTLYKYAFRLCNNALMADQIVGDVFAKLLEHFSVGTGPRANLRSHLYAMAYHLIVDEVRYSNHWTPIKGVDFTYSDGYSISANAEDRVLFEAVLQAIMNDLTHDQRQVLILRFMEGFSLKETAAIIGKKVGNVKVIQNRAINALRKALDYQVVETRAISFMIRSMSHT